MGSLCNKKKDLVVFLIIFFLCLILASQPKRMTCFPLFFFFESQRDITLILAKTKWLNNLDETSVKQQVYLLFGIKGLWCYVLISFPHLNKMHISNLPSDILRLINSKLNRKAKFDLALSSKSMYEKCRHSKNVEVFDLVLTEQLESFSHTTIINVSFHVNVDCVGYNALYTQLNCFYYLASLTVKFSDPITAKIAYSFLSSIPIAFNSSLYLFVEDKHNKVVMDQVVSSHSRKDIVVKRVKSQVTHRRKKRRTPSSTREAIKSVKKLKTLW